MFDRVLKRMEDRAYKLYLFTRIFSIVTLLISVAFYIYKIATNVSHPFYLTAYSIFLGIAVFAGVVEIVYFKRRNEDKAVRKEKNKQYRLIKKSLRYTKYVVRLATIIVGIIELVTIGGTSTKIALFVITTYFFIQELIFNIMIEVVRYRIKKFKAQFKEKHPFLFRKKDEDEIIDID